MGEDGLAKSIHVRLKLRNSYVVSILNGCPLPKMAKNLLRQQPSWPLKFIPSFHFSIPEPEYAYNRYAYKKTCIYTGCLTKEDNSREGS